MSALAFDALKFAERLIAADVPDAHVKAEAAELAEVLKLTSKMWPPKTIWTTSSWSLKLT